MSNIDCIRHHGVVDEVGDNIVKVRIVQTSACASCKVSSHCSASESKEKIVEVFNPQVDGLASGDQVVVTASHGTGFLAVYISFVIPLAIMLVVLGVIAWHGSETTAALVALCALVPYYFVVYLLRDKLRSRLTFQIDPMSVSKQQTDRR